MFAKETTFIFFFFLNSPGQNEQKSHLGVLHIKIIFRQIITAITINKKQLNLLDTLVRFIDNFFLLTLKLNQRRHFDTLRSC